MKNLKPWPKGRSPNPGGRRRNAASLTAAMKRALTVNEANAVAAKVVSVAKAGDMTAVKLLADRIDGPLSALVELSNARNPRPNETPSEFFTRLSAEAETCTARTFPGWEKPAPHIKLKWNAANDEPPAPMVISVINSEQPHPGEVASEMYRRMETQSQSDVRRSFPQWPGPSA